MNTTPPCSNESEQSVLGALLLENESFDKILNLVCTADFYYGPHRLLFAEIEKMLTGNCPVDMITLSERLESTGRLAEVGGLAYIGQLMQSTPSAANIAHYAGTVRDKSVERGLLAASNAIRDIATGHGTTTGKLDRAQAEIMKVGDQKQSNEAKPISRILAGSIEALDAKYHHGNAISGMPTGYDKLDELTAGLQDGNLIIVAGRPSMGKTSFAMNIAEHVALKSEKAVAVFSMEMSCEELGDRLLSSVGRIPMQQIRSGKVSDDSWSRLSTAVGKLATDKIIVDDSAAIGLMDIRASCRRIKRAHGLDLIVVDYMQLMTGTGENRNQEISNISRGLKAIAKEFHVPVIALSQLSRKVEERANKRPIMSDLRESGAIEQDADLILFVYRDEVYNPDTPNKGIAEIAIGKQRNGPLGTVLLTFLGEYTRFENFAGAYVEAAPRKGRGFEYD